MNLTQLFSRFANAASRHTGHPVAFLLAVSVIVAWAVTGPLFGFSDTWQLVINTGTTIVTFLMVFLIQNTQNREAVAVQVKLDELIRAVKGARNSMIDVEQLTDEELEQLRARYSQLAAKATETRAQVEGAHREIAKEHREMAEHLEDLTEAKRKTAHAKKNRDRQKAAQNS